jgi:hypothetical protein
MMRRVTGSAKGYLAGEGVGAGRVAEAAGVVEASIFKTRPAGVRSASMGVVSGVGGGGAGVAATPWVSVPCGLPPHPAAGSAADAAIASPRPTRNERLMRLALRLPRGF